MMTGKLNKVFLATLFTAVACFGFVGLSQARNADGVLGQTTLGTAGGDPSFTKYLNGNGLPDGYNVGLPADVAMDEIHHRLFVVDLFYNRVLVYNLDANNLLIDRQADYVLGRSSLDSYDNLTSDRSLLGPRGLAYNADANYLYVVDSSNNRVLVFDVAEITSGEAAINVYGQTSLTASTTGACGAGTLNSPQFVTYDASSSVIFVSDNSNNRVLSFDANTTTIGSVAINVIGQNDFVTCNSGVTTSTLNSPYGLEINTTTNKLYVADSGNNRVLVYDLNTISNGMNAAQVFGQSSFTGSGSGTTVTTMYYPVDVALDAAGNRLFVLEMNNHRVTVFDSSTTTNGAAAQNVLGSSNFTSIAGGVATQSTFYLNRSGLLFSPSSNYLYVGDFSNSRIMVFDVAAITNGENAVDELGQFDESYNPVYTTRHINNTPPSARGLGDNRGIAIDTDHHRLFVADTGNNRVLAYNLDENNNLVDYAADYVLGQANFVSSTNARTASGLYGPMALYYRAVSNTLYVADGYNNRIMVFDVASITNGESAVQVLGRSNFTESSTSAVNATSTRSPYSLAVDEDRGYLFVGELSNSRVTVFDINTTTNGVAASYVLGQADFSSSAAATTQAGMSGNWGLDYDSVSSTLFVVDSSNNRIVIYNLSGGIVNGMNATYVLGQADFVSKITGVTAANFGNVRGAKYLAEQKKLLVSDQTNRRMMIFDGSDGWSTGENAIGVLGQSDLTSNILLVPTQEYIGGVPYNMDYDSDNNRLWVTHGGYYRVTYYNFLTLPTSTLATGYLGVGYTTTLPTPTNYQETLSWSVSSGTLPTGLSLATTTGIISGAPTVTGTYSFDIRATETGTSGIYYDTQTFGITIGLPSVSLTASSYSAAENTLGSPFIISVTSTSVLDISVTFAVGDGTTAVNGSNYSYSTTTATIPAGSLTASVPLSVLYNHNVESDKALSISISNPVNSSLGNITSASLTIQNVDSAGSPMAVSVTPIATNPTTLVTTVPVTNPVTNVVNQSNSAGNTTVSTPVTTPSSLAANFTSAQARATVSTVNQILSTKRWLTYGNRGTNVKTIQQALINLGYLKISQPTGNFLSLTKQAVKRFQKANHIPTTGTVGPLTAGAMREMVNSQ